MLSALFALGFFAGGISQAAFSAGWGEWQEYIEDIEDATGTDLDDFVDDNNLYFDRVQGAMAACAVSSVTVTILPPKHNSAALAPLLHQPFTCTNAYYSSFVLSSSSLWNNLPHDALVADSLQIIS